MKTTIRMDELRTRIHDIFNMARICKWTDSQLTDRIISSIHEPMHTATQGGRARFSRWMHGYAQGVIDERRFSIWHNDVEFCYRDAEGVIYSTWKESTHRLTEEFYSTNRGHELGAMEAAHVWRGTDKPFTPWSVPNDRTGE